MSDQQQQQQLLLQQQQQQLLLQQQQQQQRQQKAKTRIPDSQRVGNYHQIKITYHHNHHPNNHHYNYYLEKLVNSIPNSLTFTMEDQAINLLLAHAKETAVSIIEEAGSLGNTNNNKYYHLYL